MPRGLSPTGGVIISAGIVLAATFAALGVIPILVLGQTAFIVAIVAIVAIGVLLITPSVRSLPVPALALEIGRRIRWPSALGRTDAGHHGVPTAACAPAPPTDPRSPNPTETP